MEKPQVRYGKDNIKNQENIRKLEKRREHERLNNISKKI